MSLPNTVGLSDIKLLKIRKRGRPKGAEKTTTGVPGKKKENKPVSFLKKYPTDREKGQFIMLI